VSRAQIERALQTEIVLRLRAGALIALPIPDGLWLPARSEPERALVARLIARMQSRRDAFARRARFSAAVGPNGGADGRIEAAKGARSVWHKASRTTQRRGRRDCSARGRTRHRPYLLHIVG